MGWSCEGSVVRGGVVRGGVVEWGSGGRWDGVGL